MAAGRREGHPGSWCDPDGPVPRKIGALGLRVERGVTYHGIALNVAPDLADFDLIDPCGMPGLASTSIAAERARAGADSQPATEPTAVARAAEVFADGARGPHRRAARPGSRREPWPRRPDAMAAGLFELRKDPITGWWVATVVDRAFHLDRFAQPALPIDDRGDCQNCRLPEGQGIRTRMLKDFAFHVVGTDEESREIDGAMAQVALVAGARERQLADDRRAARRAPARSMRSATRSSRG